MEHEVATGDYADAEDYLGQLVDAAAQQKLAQLLVEGLNSEELDWSPELLHEVRRNAHLA